MVVFFFFFTTSHVAAALYFQDYYATKPATSPYYNLKFKAGLKLEEYIEERKVGVFLGLFFGCCLHGQVKLRCVHGDTQWRVFPVVM